MKRFLVLFLIAALAFSLSSCTESADSTTEAETHPIEEITTGKQYTLSQMSPDIAEINPPEEVKIRVSDIDFDSFEEIDAEDSVLPGVGHDRILQSENAQYFFVDDDIKVHAIFYDENKKITCSASYNTQIGYVEFIGNDKMSWYFDENGEFTLAVYTFTGDNNELMPIYTFYNSDGEKEAVRAANGWFTPDMEPFSQSQTLEIIKKYSSVIEATAEYK